MKICFKSKGQQAAKILAMTAVLIAAALGFGGCADYAAMGVGYSDAYYVPDYHPFYAGYFYDGYPWWGSSPYFTKKVVVKDIDKQVNVNRNVYYGGHHLSGDWGSRGPRSFAHIGRRGGPGGHR
jgi:hypothetical protein